MTEQDSTAAKTTQAALTEDDNPSTVDAIERIVAFHLGGQRYGLPIERINEIQQIVAFSDVPAGGSSVVGMVNLRGTVIPAIDLRLLIGLEPRDYTLETPMIITRTCGQTVALIVDDVQDVLEMPEDCLQTAPPMHALSAKMIGVCRMDDGLIYLLDVDRLLGADMLGGGR